MDRFLITQKHCILLALSCYVITTSAQGWQRILPTPIDPKSCFIDNADTYFVLGVYSNDLTYRLSKIDKRGIELWHRDYPDMTYDKLNDLNILRAPNGKLLIYGLADSSYALGLRELDEQGNIVRYKEIARGWRGGFAKATQSELYVLLNSGTALQSVILRLNSKGDTLSIANLGVFSFGDFIVESDGYTGVGWNGIKKIDFNGTEKWFQPLSNEETQGGYLLISKGKDSSYYVTSRNYFIKFDKNGNRLWSKKLPFTMYHSALDTDDGMVLVGTTRMVDIDRRNQDVYKYNKNGDLLWHRQFYTEQDAYLTRIIKIPTGGFLGYGLWYPGAKTFMIRFTSDGFLYSNFLQGRVTNDLDKNCTLSTGDIACKNCMVEATKDNGDVFRGTSDNQGFYNLNLEPGSYNVKSYPLTFSAYWQSCTPSVSTTINSAKPNDTLDFYLKPSIVSPAMEVNTSTALLRRCFVNNYTVKYCNRGTLETDKAYVVVTLDSLLEYISATRPLTSKTGRQYRFDIGKVDIGDCGTFNIAARVRCGDSTRLGQTLCVESKIYPDTVVTLNSLWSGAHIEVTGVCQKDSILFQVKNTGKAPSALLNGYVIENDILRFKRTIKLPINGFFTEKIAGSGTTWRMTVDQEPNHPTSTNPTAFVEGCGVSSLSLRSEGFATKFANDDKALFIALDCQPIIGSFDPNDKVGYPTGYANSHYIPQNQDIDYKIRFQNTGTDTAFTVVIRDTISENLDITTVELGASSHPYTVEIYNKNILKFTFDNINLVDSFKNEPQSHGFVGYRIKQKKDLVFGTKISNTAGIYFDFNTPVITNTTLHTVGINSIISTAIEKNNFPFEVKVAPNPFLEKVNFEWPPNLIDPNLIFELYDITGMLLYKDTFSGNRYTFHRHKTASGIYFYKIITENGYPLSIGKLLAL